MGLLKKSIVGLEFDVGSIRAVEVTGKKNNVRVVAAGEVFLPPAAYADGLIKDAKTVCLALEKLWRDAGIGSKRLVLGFFNHGVLVRPVNFPKVPREKLDSALRLQAGEYLPLPPSEMVLDFAVLGEIAEQGIKKWEILLVAARKEYLLKMVNVLEQCGLQLLVIDATLLALQRVLPADKLAGTVIIVNLAMGLCSMALVVDGKTRMARTLPVSLQQFFSQFGGIGPLEAGTVLSAGAEADSEILDKQVFRNWAGRSGKEIRTAISLLRRQMHIQRVERLVLCGAGAGVPGITAYLEKELGIAAETVKPAALLTVTGNIKTNINRPEFAASIGLALRGLEV